MNKKYLVLLLLVGLVGCTKTPDSSISSKVNSSTTEESNSVEVSSSSEDIEIKNTGVISSGTGWLPPI